MIEISKIEIKLANIIENNSYLEKKFSLRKKSIQKLTGIKKRYISRPNDTSEKNAYLVCKKLSKKNLVSLTHIISVTNTPSIKFPGISNFVASNLNLENVHCINLNSGCTGYVDALSLSYDIISNNNKNKILIVTTDTYSKFINKNNRSVRPLFSDGASASIIKYSKKGFKLKIRKFKNIKNTQDDLSFKDNEIKMNGPAVASFAMQHVVPEIKKYQKYVDSIFVHQAGNIVHRVIEKNVNKKVFLPKNYDKYGNLVSGSIPFLIKDTFKEFKKLKRVIFCGFGVGLSFSLIVLKK